MNNFKVVFNIHNKSHIYSVSYVFHCFIIDTVIYQLEEVFPKLLIAFFFFSVKIDISL